MCIDRKHIVQPIDTNHWILKIPGGHYVEAAATRNRDPMIQTFSNKIVGICCPTFEDYRISLVSLHLWKPRRGRHEPGATLPRRGQHPPPAASGPTGPSEPRCSGPFSSSTLVIVGWRFDGLLPSWSWLAATLNSPLRNSKLRNSPLRHSPLRNSSPSFGTTPCAFGERTLAASDARTLAPSDARTSAPSDARTSGSDVRLPRKLSKT
jgi:hypothetical protein